MTGVGTLRLFLREGDRFVDASDSLGVTPRAAEVYMSAAAGDVDGDGDLDLAIAGFLDAVELDDG